MSACVTCGTELPPPVCAVGRPRKFCSEYCRKRQYDLVCVDCGGRVNGTYPSRLPREPRCRRCTRRMVADRDRYWTRERITARIQEWAGLHEGPPSLDDWNPYVARHVLHDEDRAKRFEDAKGHWPGFNSVVRVFGTWNKAIRAAGFTPRAAHGGADNEVRKRKYREQVAA